MSDSLLQAIISGNPLGLPGLGSNDSGVTILFPLSMGNTVTDLASTLNVPVDSILAVNPGLQADTPLTVSQVIGLPEGHINQIMRSLDPGLGRSYGSSPSSSSQGISPTTSIPHGGYLDHLVHDGMHMAPPLLRSMPAALDMYNTPKQDSPLASQGSEEATDRWRVSVDPHLLATGVSESRDVPAAITSVSVLSLTSSSAQASTLILTPTPTPAPTTVPAPVPATAPEMQASNIDPRNVTLIASGYGRSVAESPLSFAPVERPFIQTQQGRGRNPPLNPPPPLMLVDGSRPTVQVTWVVPPRSTEFVPPVVTQNTTVVPADNRPFTLQLMALLLAQSDSSAATTASPQGPSFIDPQAIAALVATMRTTKVIDLGAGRSMEFSLAADRMRRIDPIGQEDRVTSRRTGAGLEEVRVSPRNAEDVEQTDEQREQGRRRRAAIAAMRRRRRLRSRRCRYWHGARSDLRPSGTVRYPKRMDFAEFQSRQPPRYMWNAGGGGS
ncbi:hypothetical protein [Dyella acidisoli]|uniref:LysM domain-containing protein n=1 Tax=Dyella acidisoli TaxID=1867834 RepID=A0ABQ5XPH3_9GAMM|nr:hypothetical protein [Dyella acidisoli]GLQ93637.1 hypothetical protein GCM10007901_25880 [Dyella acidisoli]